MFMFSHAPPISHREDSGSASSHSDDLIFKFCTVTAPLSLSSMLAMQAEREGGEVYLLRHGRSEMPSHAFHPVTLKPLSSMLAMQTELGGLASYAFHTVALKSLPSVLLSPVAMQAEGGGALPHFSRGRSDHVSHAGREVCLLP